MAAGEHADMLIVHVADVHVVLDDEALEQIRGWVADSDVDTAVVLQVERPGGAMLKPVAVVERHGWRDVSEDWVTVNEIGLKEGLHATVVGDSVSVTIAHTEPALSLQFTNFTDTGLPGDDPRPLRRYRCVTENFSFEVTGVLAQCPHDSSHFIEAA